MFGPSTTANVFSITRAIGHDLRPGDEIICTQLDHDSNVSPWLLVAEDTGAAVRFADVRPSDGSPPPRGRHRAADRAHSVGRRHRGQQRDRHDARHHGDHRRRTRRRRQGDGRRCPPHAARPGRRHGDRMRCVLDQQLQVVRTARRRHVDRTGTARPAARLQGSPGARYRTRTVACSAHRRTRASPPSTPPPSSCSTPGWTSIRAHERQLFARLLDGLLADDRVTVYGPHDLADRAPTLAFNVDGHTAARRRQASRSRADRRVGRPLLRPRGDGGARYRRCRPCRDRGLPHESTTSTACSTSSTGSDGPDSVADVSDLAERLGYPADAKLVILSCDDLGSCHAANVGVYQAIRDGLATCASIMVPAPWARHAAADYRAADDIGVHLTLNAEHEMYRWGPLTHAPSLLSGDGGFPRDHRRPVGARRLRRGLPRAQGADHARDRVGHRRHPPRAPPHGDHAAARVLRHLSRAGHRVPAPDATAVDRSRPSRPAFRSASWPTDAGVVFPDHFDHDWRAGSRERVTIALRNLQPGVTEVHVQPAIDTPEVRALTAARRALDRRSHLRHGRPRVAGPDRRGRCRVDRLPAAQGCDASRLSAAVASPDFSTSSTAPA